MKKHKNFISEKDSSQVESAKSPFQEDKISLVDNVTVKITHRNLDDKSYLNKQHPLMD